MAALVKYLMSIAVIVTSVIFVAIFLGFAAVVATPATTVPAWKIERQKPEPNTPYIGQGSLSPIYPATPGKELLGKPIALAARVPNTLHKAVTAKRIATRQALQIHKLPRQIYVAGEEHQSYSKQSYGYAEERVLQPRSVIVFGHGIY
jgi:hypothetical protein